MKDNTDPVNQVLADLRKLAPIEDLSASTVELAKRVVREARGKTPGELNEWAERLVADIVDAKD